jgi:hypothetical protein
MDDRGPIENAEQADKAAIEERRKLLKIGAYAAYTAPILLAMATSAKAAVVSNPPPPKM